MSMLLGLTRRVSRVELQAGPVDILGMVKANGARLVRQKAREEGLVIDHMHVGHQYVCWRKDPETGEMEEWGYDGGVPPEMFGREWHAVVVRIEAVCDDLEGQ